MKTKNTNPSQANKILKYLKSGRSLTAMQALVAFQCFRLAARVHELKKKGHNIKQSTIVSKGKTYAKYTLKRK